MMHSSKKVLVAGGAGFLGAHLCRRLVQQGHQVLCLDNFSTGCVSNIEALQSSTHFSYVAHDVTLPLYDAFDQIFNLACPASPVHYQNDPIHTLKTSVLGALNLLELARVTQSKIFQASTSEVYGDPHIHPQKETYHGSVNPLGKRACYDEGKRAAETLFMDYYRCHQVPVCIARIFNTYGPYMRPHDGRVISNFIVQALKNQPLTLYGQGLQTRSFCYVDDLIEGIVLLMEHPTCIGPVNLGNPEEISVKTLAQLIVDMTGSSSSFVYHPLPEDDPRSRCPDISYAEEQIGWKPTTSLREGLLKTIQYFEHKLSICRSDTLLSPHIENA